MDEQGKARQGKTSKGRQSNGKDRGGARAKEGWKEGLVGTCLRVEFSPQADKPGIPLFNIFISGL